MSESIDKLNAILAKLGLFGGGRTRHSWVHWRVPRDWKGRKPLFGYTPWKTEYEGKTGFFAVVYRWKPAKKGYQLTKKVRCATRKRAKKLSRQWHEEYYSQP